MGEFHLACNDCRFSTVVSGDVLDVYDRIEEHRDRRSGDALDHEVDFVRNLVRHP